MTVTALAAISLAAAGCGDEQSSSAATSSTRGNPAADQATASAAPRAAGNGALARRIIQAQRRELGQMRRRLATRTVGRTRPARPPGPRDPRTGPPDMPGSDGNGRAPRQSERRPHPTGRDGAGRPRPGGDRSSAERVPAGEFGQRVDRGAAQIPAGCRPHLKMQMASRGSAGLADLTDRLTGQHPLALA